MKGVYIAAPFGGKTLAQAWADALQIHGLEVCSTWHASPSVRDPLDPATRQRLAETCTAEVRAAGALLFLDSDVLQPRGALVEVGIAVALGLTVVWYGRPSKGVNVWDSHPRTIVTSDAGVAIRSLFLASSTIEPFDRGPPGWDLVP